MSGSREGASAKEEQTVKGDYTVEFWNNRKISERYNVPVQEKDNCTNNSMTLNWDVCSTEPWNISFGYCMPTIADHVKMIVLESNGTTQRLLYDS
jgi:hypothetical protein